MKISGWHINGFGMFADYRIDDLSPDLTVLHGPNEAGKSMLVAFVMSVLFGFADGRSKGPRYEPLRGGQHGGRLFLRTDVGDYTVDRTKKGRSPVVTRPDGTAGGEKELKDLLGGADRRLFSNIFAFSLHELEELSALRDDAVRERIFATPTFGGGRSPGEVLKALQARETKLLRPRATSTIGDLMRGLKEANSVLREAQAESKTYPRAVSDLDDAVRAVDRLTDELNHASNEASRYQTLVDIWPDWSALSAALTELSPLVTPEGVTPAIEDRLNEVRQEIKQVQVKVDERQTELERLQSRLNRLVVDDRLPPVAKEAKTLYVGVAAYDAYLTRLTELDVQIENQHSNLSKVMTDLGPAWNQERVEHFDTSIPTADEVRTWRDQIRAIDEGVDRHTTQVADLTDRLGEATEDCTRIEKNLEDHRDTPEMDAIESADTSARRLRGSIADAAPVRERAESAVQRLEDRQRDLAGTRSADVLGVPRGVLVGLPALLVAGAVAAGVLGEIAAAVILGLLAIVFVGGLLMPGLSSKKRSISAAEEAVREAEEAVDARRHNYDVLEQQVLEEAVGLGFDDIPSNAEIEERLGVVARQRSARGGADALASRLEEALEKKKSLQETLEESQQELGSLRSEREEQGRKWDAWRAGKGISEQLSPELAIELFPAIKMTRDAWGQLHETESERERVSQLVTSFEETSARVLAAAERDDAVRGSALGAALDTLHTDINKDGKTRDDSAGIQTGIRGARKAVTEAEGELEKAESARRRILAEAEVSDDASFEEVVRSIRRRLELEDQISELTRRIEAAIGKGSDAEAIQLELESGELGTWQQSRIEEQQKVDQLREDRDEALGERQDKKTAKKQIAASADVATRGIEVEGYRRHLTEEIGEWQRVVLARSLIEETLSKFEQEHQPHVVTRAAQLFETITEGRYPEVVSGEDALSVISRDGERIDVVDLSTGTVQQLYLCLRFALAEEFAEKGTLLPLIMDDVLVNFDPERAAQVAQVIADVSTRHQILLLTCHPETRTLIEHAAPGARIVELERFAG